MPRWPVVPACACVVVLRAATLAQAQSPRDLYTRAAQLESQGNHPAALTLLWEAAGLAPRDADIQNRLGEALDRIGALDGAIEAYRRAVAARPDFTDADNNLTLALAKAGRGREAVERARARVAGAPGNVDAQFTLGLALSEQDVDEAMRTFRQVIARRPGHVLAHYNLALVLKRLDRTKEAIGELQRALEIQPRAEAHFTLGTLYFHEGDFDRAATSLRAAIAAQPRFADAYVKLAAVLRAKHQLPDAVDALRRAIVLQPESSSTHAALATVLQLAGESEAARQEAAEAERRRLEGQLEREAAALTAVGIASLDSGDSTTAVERFRGAIAVDGSYAPAHYQLGRALQRAGDASGAQAAFARARQLNPSLVPPDVIR